MTQLGHLSLHVSVVDEGWATTAALSLGSVDLPLGRDELGSLDLRQHPAMVADLLRRAAHEIAPAV